MNFTTTHAYKRPHFQFDSGDCERSISFSFWRSLSCFLRLLIFRVFSCNCIDNSCRPGELAPVLLVASPNSSVSTPRRYFFNQGINVSNARNRQDAFARLPNASPKRSFNRHKRPNSSRYGCRWASWARRSRLKAKGRPSSFTGPISPTPGAKKLRN